MKRFLVFILGALLLSVALVACQPGEVTLNITPGPGPHGTVNIDVTAEGTFPKDVTRKLGILHVQDIKTGVMQPARFKDFEGNQVAWHLELPKGRWRVAVDMQVYINHGQGKVPERLRGIMSEERFSVGEGGAIENIEVIPPQQEG